MKRFIAPILLALLPAQSFAGSISAGGVPPPPAKADARVLVEYTMGGGLTPYYSLTKLTIASDGAVVYRTEQAPWNDRQNVRVTVKNVARLSADAVTKLAAQLENVQGDLVDLNAGQPLCTDAPGSAYTLRRSDDANVRFAAWGSCHSFIVRGSEWLKGLVDGFVTIAR